MPGLLRGMVRTAVVSGTATAVSNRVSRRQAQRWGEQDARQFYDEEPAPGPVPVAAAPQDPISQLRELAELKNQGILTEDEFSAQKARILAG